MTRFDKSEKLADAFKRIFPKGCPVCGEDATKRILGGVKNGRDEPFDGRIICFNCGTDITAEYEEKNISQA